MKMVLAGLAIVAAAIGGGIGYAGMQTAALPDWYSRASQTVQPNEQAQAKSSSTSEEVFSDSTSTPLYRPDDVVISEQELNDMVTGAITSDPYAATILDSAKGVNTTIEDGRIESGMVLNLSEIPLDALPNEGQQAVEQITQTFPFLANREVYLGIEGSPAVVDGALSLDDTHIKLGQLKLPVSKIASQLGVSQSEIEQQISQLLNQQGLSPEDIQVVDGQIVITGVSQ